MDLKSAESIAVIAAGLVAVLTFTLQHTSKIPPPGAILGYIYRHERLRKFAKHFAIPIFTATVAGLIILLAAPFVNNYLASHKWLPSASAFDSSESSEKARTAQSNDASQDAKGEIVTPVPSDEKSIVVRGQDSVGGEKKPSLCADHSRVPVGDFVNISGFYYRCKHCQGILKFVADAGGVTPEWPEATELAPAPPPKNQVIRQRNGSK